MKNVLVVLKNGVVQDIYSPEDSIDVTVIDIGKKETYSYGNYICVITGFNADKGTVDLRAVDCMDDSLTSRLPYFSGVSSSEISLYVIDDDIIDLEDGDDLPDLDDDYDTDGD